MKKYENQLPQAGRGNVHVAYQGKAIDQMIYDFMEEQGIPGMTLAIVQAPYIPRVAGYGVTDLEKGNLAAAKTLWPIGPISQGYAAVAVMQLYEKGKLDLNDPIGKYLKDIPENWKPISILQLMQHSSGIADYRNEKGFDVSADYRPEQLIETVAAIPLAFEPGTDVKQSATNFLLLTSIIEKTGKMPYHDFVKKYQIDYLGLKQTFFGEDLAKVKQEDVTLTGFYDDEAIPTWAKGYVSSALKAGAIQGSLDQEGQPVFGSGETVTRGEATVMLDNLMGILDVPAEVFASESGGHWAGQAAANLSASGVIHGGDDSAQAMADPLTRADVAELLDGAMDVMADQDGSIWFSWS